MQVQAGKKPGVLYLKDQSTGYVFTLSIPVDQQASLVSVIQTCIKRRQFGWCSGTDRMGG